MHAGIYVCVIFIAKDKVKPYKVFKRRNKHNEEKINVHGHTASFYAVMFCTVDPQPSVDLTSTCICFTTTFIYIYAVNALAHIGDPSHSAKSAGCRLLLNTHAPYIYIYMQMCVCVWFCMKWHGTWLYGVHRTCRDSSSFTWHQPCKWSTRTLNILVPAEKVIMKF